MSVIPEKAARGWGSPVRGCWRERERPCGACGDRGSGAGLAGGPRPGLGEPPAAEPGAQVRLQVPPGWCRLRSVRSLHFLGPISELPSGRLTGVNRPWMIFPNCPKAGFRQISFSLCRSPSFYQRNLKTDTGERASAGVSFLGHIRSPSALETFFKPVLVSPDSSEPARPVCLSEALLSLVARSLQQQL